MLSNIMNGAFIILIGFFAFQNMSLVLTKLRFVESADDLNASFLTLRLSEKNYFLYHDRKELGEKPGCYDLRRFKSRHQPANTHCSSDSSGRFRYTVMVISVTLTQLVAHHGSHSTVMQRSQSLSQEGL